MGDKLVEIPLKQLENLKEKYQENWPSNLVPYYTIQNYINWFEKVSSLPKIKFYSLNGDFRDGTYLIVDHCQVFCGTLEKSCDRLKRGLALLDWRRGLYVSTLLEQHYDVVVTSIKEDLRVDFHHSYFTYLFFCSRDDARNVILKIPEGITLKSIGEEDALQINEGWAYKNSTSINYIKHIIRLNVNVGVYNQNNELLAWCLRNQAGALAVLQVAKNNFRKGLGTLVIKYMMKTIGDTDSDVFAYIVEENTPAINIFKKCGFKEKAKTYWLVVKPTDANVESFEWTDD